MGVYFVKFFDGSSYLLALNVKPLATIVNRANSNTKQSSLMLYIYAL